MFSIVRNNVSMPTKKAPQLELFMDDDCTYVEVRGWGDIEDIRLLPMDRLILHKGTEIDESPSYVSGELLVLKPRGWGRIALGRKFGEYILLEPFGKPISMDHWGIIGAVLAVERGLGMGVSVGVAAHIALYNAPKHYDLHINSEHLCDPLYIEELSVRLQEEAPQASCVVAHNPDWLHSLLAQVPSGVLWISPTTQESVPEHCQEWQIMSKREQRKNWMNRHKPLSVHHSFLPNNPKDEKTEKEHVANMIASK